jgi:hypothetical protein
MVNRTTLFLAAFVPVRGDCISPIASFDNLIILDEFSGADDDGGNGR